MDARAGIERSTGCRRWDSRVFAVSCRPGLNDPPAAAGGIPESQNLCRNFSCPVRAAFVTELLKENCERSGPGLLPTRRVCQEATSGRGKVEPAPGAA